MKFKRTFMLLSILLLTACESENPELIKERNEDAIEFVAKELGVPMSDVSTEIVEIGEYSLGETKMYIRIKGSDDIYVYQGTGLGGYELILYSN